VLAAAFDGIEGNSPSAGAVVDHLTMGKIGSLSFSFSLFFFFSFRY
jgi:glycerate-2-kinase